METMEKYRSRLIFRMTYTAVIVIIAAAVFISGLTGVFDSFGPKGDFGDFLSGFQFGLFTALMLEAIFSIVKMLSALKNRDKLKRMYIGETDERSKAICEKSGHNLFMAWCYPMLLAAIISGYFSSIVFFTLLGALVFMILVYYALVIYYKKTM